MENIELIESLYRLTQNVQMKEIASLFQLICMENCIIYISICKECLFIFQN